MESTAIPAGAAPDHATMQVLQSLADRRGLTIETEALAAAAVFDVWLAPHQRMLRDYKLSFIDPVEPATVFQWIERGGRSV